MGVYPTVLRQASLIHWRAGDEAWDSGGQQEATESVNLVSEVPDSAPGTPPAWPWEIHSWLCNALDHCPSLLPMKM